MEEETKCKYCGCEAGDHPVHSIPLGSFTCAGCGGCPLLKEYVIKLFGGS